MENLESRVTDLEIQLSYQIRTLEELNSVIIQQQKQIENLEQVNKFLIESSKTSAFDENQIVSDYTGRKPPHY